MHGSATDPDNNPIAGWRWTVVSSPDGSTPYFTSPRQPHPSFSGDVLGVYLLSLEATDGMAWSEPDYVTVTVVELLPPVAIATADVTYGPAPLTVHFDGSQSYDPQGGPLTYGWTFGDGSGPSVVVSPSHTYDSPGTFEVIFGVQDELGQQTDDYLLITVTNPTADADGDGIPDAADKCPHEDATGYDADGDGCIDSLGGLDATIQTLVAQGVISPALQNSLLSKLQNAIDSFENHKICPAVKMLEALKNEVQAQIGKKISYDAAVLIINYADNLIRTLLENLPEGDRCR